MLGLSYVYAAHGTIPAVAGVLNGFKPVVVAIVAEAVLRIGRRAFKRRVHICIAGAGFLAIYFLRVPFPLIVLGAAIVGLAGTRFWAAGFESRVQQERESKSGGSSEHLEVVIEDGAAAPAHTLPSRARALRTLATALVLWIAPLALLAAWRGWGSLHAQEYRFFTQAALVTFGGAYAVLVYVTQAAVSGYGWLTSAQAIDGLALAETTPGPLIMVLQFVGFMAAYQHAEGMSATASGILGALVTSYTTFLPCFFFIFLGAPYIEKLRGNRNLTGALSGITAAVVGAILNLALVFGGAVIWPHGRAGGTNWFAVAATTAAFVALYRFKVDVLWVVIAGGVVGLLMNLMF